MLDNNPLYSHIKIPENKVYNITSYKRQNPLEWVINNHYHNIYEIVLYKEITGNVSLNNESIPITSYKLLYIPPYAVHGFILPKQDCEYIVLHTSNSFLLNLPQYPQVLELDKQNVQTLELLMMWAENLDYSSEFRYNSVKLLLSWIVEQKGDLIKSFNHNSKYFTPLLKYINESKIYTLSTTQASEICNMSRSSFLNHFKKYFKVSFHAFLLERRIDEAKYLLTNSTLNCSEISQQLGFSDASHFTRVFKKITKKLPKFYS